MPTNLAALVSTTQAHAYAPGTIHNLHSLWKSFLNFCTAYCVTPLPATPHTIASYACFLAGKTSSYQYILNHLNAVRLLHQFNGFAVDALDSFDVTLTKRGLKCLLGTLPRQKHPITPEILLQMHHHLNTSLPFHAVIWALFCTVFFSFCLQIQFDSHLSPVLRPHPASCSPRHQIHYDRCSSVHPLDENSATQRRSPPNTTSQHSQICPLSRICHRTLLRPGSRSTISTTVLPLHSFQLWSHYVLYVYRLSETPNFQNWARTSQLLASQFSAWQCYIRLSIWCAGTSNQTPRRLAFRRFPRLSGSSTDFPYPGRRHHGRRAVALQTVTAF